MISECKKCKSKNLYLEPRIAGQDILTADMVALKCKDCGNWLKWCPKNERVNYLKIQDEKPDKWQELKEWIEKDHDWNLERGNNDCALGQRWVLDKMQELEGEYDGNND